MSLAISLETIARLLPKIPEISLIPKLYTPIAIPFPSLHRKIQEIFGEGLQDLKDGLFRAVPKKKVSHRKKNQKLYGPARKQLKHLHNLNRCPSCGHYKRANTVCMHCFYEIKNLWKSKEPVEDPIKDLDEVDKKLIYPGRVETEYQKKLKDTDKYVLKYPRSLPVEKKK